MNFLVSFWQKDGIAFNEKYATEAEAIEAVETATSVGIPSAAFKLEAWGVGAQIKSNF